MERAEAKDEILSEGDVLVQSPNKKRKRKEAETLGQKLDTNQSSKRRKTLEQLSSDLSTTPKTDGDVGEERFYIAQELRTTERTFLKHLLTMKSVSLSLSLF